MLLIAALLLVSVASLGVCVAALANPRDPLLRDPRPLTCSLCPRRRFTTEAEFYAHRCGRVTR